MDNLVTQQVAEFWRQVGSVIPSVAAALLVLFLGWIAATIVRRLAVKAMRLARVDVLAERAGIEGFLVQGGIRFTAVSIIGWSIYWLLILAAISLALGVVGIAGADVILRRTLLYIPKMLVAVLIFSFGAIFARVARGILATYLANVGVEGARAISVIAQYGILAFVATMALEQLEIGGETLTAAFKMAFGGFCLAFGLAFGLGGRRWAQALLERMWKP